MHPLGLRRGGERWETRGRSRCRFARDPQDPGKAEVQSEPGGVKPWEPVWKGLWEALKYTSLSCLASEFLLCYFRREVGHPG